MISKEEIKKLADLARIEVSDEEAQSLTGEMDSILDYVGQVKSMAYIDLDQNSGEVNVMREDEALNESGKYSKELIEEFPNKEGDYLKVKKIL